MHPVPILAIWLGWSIYWTLGAIGNKAVRRRPPLASRVADIVPLALAILLLAAGSTPFRPGWSAWLNQGFAPRTEAGYWAGLVILVLGLGFAIWARHALGRNWSGTVTLKEDHELIRSGPYRFVRHPIYTGILLGFAGSAIALEEWRGIVAALLVLFAFWRRIRIEELWMIETFGPRYAKYQTEVKALIPFVL
jgi:protein-S-isoprenylcysteine O-methyltransferase Ste14